MSALAVIFAILLAIVAFKVFAHALPWIILIGVIAAVVVVVRAYNGQTK